MKRATFLQRQISAWARRRYTSSVGAPSAAVITSTCATRMPSTSSLPCAPDAFMMINSRYLTYSKSNYSGEEGNVSLATDSQDVEPNEKPHPKSSLKYEPSSYTDAVPIKMPDMSEGDDNVVETWYKKPGDVIMYNDILCDIATPDFTFGLVIDDETDAIMGEIEVPAGQQAPDNATICTVFHPEKGATKQKKEDKVEEKEE